MEEEESLGPYLYSLRPLNENLQNCKKIPIVSKNMTIGRHISNDFVLPDTTLSRKICKISMNDNKKWIIEDLSTHGIKVNNVLCNKSETPIELKESDIIQFDYHGNFLYKFFDPKLEDVARKRKGNINEFIESLFPTNQTSKVRRTSNDTQDTVNIIKDIVDIKLRNRIKKLELKYQQEIQALKGEKDQVLKEKITIETARMLDLKFIQQEMEGKIRHQKEQGLKILKENEEIKKIHNLMLATIKAQEVVVNQDKKDIELLKKKEAMLQRAEQIERDILEKKRNLLALEAQCKEAEEEYKQITDNLSNSKLLIEKAEKEKAEAEMKVAALQAAAPQTVTPQAPAPQAEAPQASPPQASAPKVAVPSASSFNLDEVVESELHCSICSELFIKATTLNCSHTFCLYCITVWKKKAGVCPICRTPITSLCTSFALDAFIDKLVENYSKQLKETRKSLINQRLEILETPNVKRSSKRKRRR